MKTLTLILLISLLSLNARAGYDAPNLVVSQYQPQYETGHAPSPVENKASTLWYFSWFYDMCIIWEDVHVNYQSNQINVFSLESLLFPGCVPLPTVPPREYYERMPVQPLEQGLYTLNYYSVPEGDIFPPNPTDYDNYFVETIEFEVLEGPPTIDATSNLSLALLIFMLIMSGFVKMTFNKRQQTNQIRIQK